MTNDMPEPTRQALRDVRHAARQAAMHLDKLASRLRAKELEALPDLQMWADVNLDTVYRLTSWTQAIAADAFHYSGAPDEDAAEYEDTPAAPTMWDQETYARAMAAVRAYGQAVADMADSAATQPDGDQFARRYEAVCTAFEQVKEVLRELTQSADGPTA